MKVTDKYVLFWSGEFSNFYPYGNLKEDETRHVEPLNFRNSDGVWKTSEHYYMWMKAKYFHNEAIAALIKTVPHPSLAKKLCRDMEGFDAKQWSAVQFYAMHRALYSKFSSVEKCKKKLLSDKYKGKHFVEASPLDTIWGIGLHFRDPLAEDEKNWKGQNLLGKCLDIVREELLENNK